MRWPGLGQVASNCAECGHPQAAHDALGFCLSRGCRCSGYEAATEMEEEGEAAPYVLDDEDEMDLEPEPLDFDQDRER